MSKLWSGRFTKETDSLVDEFTSSIGFDHKLAMEDIEGSLAHARMLGECGIISEEDAKLLQQGLLSIKKRIDEGDVKWSISDEDIHMNIEKMLIEEIGPIGGKLHTGRSRNDQVATDMHLYLRKETEKLISLLESVQIALLEKAKEHSDTLMPGYTHLQRAQPIFFAHHLLAYFWMFERDKERLSDSLKRINWLPLGAGALAGTTFAIDRNRTAEMLGFDKIYPNSIDAVSDRDFILEFLSIASIIMMHISRLSEELVIWSSQEFQFIELDDSFCTGSSIMPQKKNPDVPELLRAKTGRVYGNLFGLLTVLKGLPLAYNKDMQEDKEGMFDSVETLITSLSILAPLIKTMTVHSTNMEKAVTSDYSNATDLADYLVRKGFTFRKAHELTGNIVLYAIEQKRFLLELNLEEFQKFSSFIDETIFEALKPVCVANARNSYGGTSFQQVQIQINEAELKIYGNKK